MLLATISGCAIFEKHATDSRVTKIEQWIGGDDSEQEDALSLLDWFKTVDNMPPKMLEATHKSVEREFSKKPTKVTRLKLAWLLTMNNTGFQDVARAAALLNSKHKNHDRGRQSDAINNLEHLIQNSVLKQKHQHDKYRQVVELLNKEQETSKQLEAKIKDLTQIEKSMIQRKSLPEAEIR